MVLVLLVVPAIIAMQHDVGNLFRTMQKATRARRARGLQALVITLWVLVLGWGAVTMGAYSVTGSLWAPIADLLPAQFAEMSMPRALALFAAGSAVLCFAGYVIGALGFVLRRRPKTQAA